MTKKMLSLLLALVLCLGLVVPASAETVSDARQSHDVGFRSVAFRDELSRYSPDDTVRAIVTLKSEPAVMSLEAEAQAVAAVQSQQASVQRAMTRQGVDFEIQHSFDTLLNGFSCDVAYGDLDKIADLPNVEAVYIANSYSVPTVTRREAAPQMLSSNASTGVDQLRDYFLSLDAAPYYGEGMVVAVLDTGLNTEHEAFASNDVMEKTGVITEETIEAAGLDVQGAYLSAKVPFAYDYADGDDDVSDNVGHGTHVSGIVAGLTVDEDGQWTFSGVAPYAQIVSMKIFSDYDGSTTTDIYFQAMEDAYKLGVDVINLSIGAQNGFTYDQSLEGLLGNVFEELSDAGIVLSVAGGNQFSMDYYSAVGYTSTDYQDYGTISSPASYTGSTSVASMENSSYPAKAIAVDGKYFKYVDSCDDYEHGWMDNFGGETIEYVIVEDKDEQNPTESGVSLGYAEDFEGLDLTDKIAVVQRGVINYTDKVANAAEAGAAGCIVLNTVSSDNMGMSIDYYGIPAIIVTVDALEVMQNAVEQTVTTCADDQLVPNSTAGQLSDFSNWGTTPDLTIDPVITSVGGGVYSAVIGDADSYGVYDGTSMAAPNFAGAVLLTIQHLKDCDEDASKVELAQKALAVLESTATMVEEPDGGYYSVRKQGSGMANVFDAAVAYEESGYIADPIQELGDDPEKSGEYTFEMTLVNENLIGRDADYRLSTVLQCGDAEEVEDGYINTLTTKTLVEGEDFTVSYGSSSTVTVKNGEEAKVTVTITLTDAAKAWLDEVYDYGTYIEGYVLAEDMDEGKVIDTLHATMLAYYGDWTEGPVVESVDYADYLNAEYEAYHDGADVEYDTINYMDEPYYTRPNMALNATFAYGEPDMPSYYVGGNLYDVNYETQYDPAHNAMSTVLATEENGGYGTSSHGIYVTLSQLRNLESATMTITDADDPETVYYTQTRNYVSKCYYDEGWYPDDVFYWDGYSEELWDYVPSGTVVKVTFDGVLPWKHTPVSDLWSFTLEVDYEAPWVTETVYDPDEDTLTVTACDESYLASVKLVDEYGTIQDVKVVTESVEGEDATVAFDVSWMVASGMKSVNVVAVDYATNESWAMPAPLYELDQPATITLVTPYGNEEYEYLTGEYFELPEGQEVEGYKFSCWTDYSIPEDEAVESIDWIYPTYNAGDWMEVSGDATYYTVYAKGETVEYETPKFYVDASNTDYSGTFAIVGINTDEWEYFICEEPQIWTENLETVDGVTEYGITPPVIDEDDFEYNFEFFSDKDSFCYEIALCDDGYYYTIQNSQGKYLALGGDYENYDYELTLVDEADYDAYTTMWDVQLGGFDGNVTVRSAYDYYMVLGYNDADGVIGIWDDTVYVEAGDWGEMLPSEWYYLWLYRRVTEEFVAEYYTTEPTVEAKPEPTPDPEPDPEPEPDPDPAPDVPVRPILPVKPSKPSKPTTPQEPEVQVPETPQNPYTDVQESDKAYEAIMYLYENGIMEGVGNGKFDPNATLTRAMVVTILYRMDGQEDVTFAGTFSDVADGLWYSNAVEWAAKHGIVNGMGDGTFAPDGEITREQLAAILYRYAAYKGLDTCVFAELNASAQVSSWAVFYVRWAVALDLLEGGSSVNATAFANRAEVALAIYGFIQKLMK